MLWRWSYFLLKKFKLGVTYLYDHQMLDDRRFLELIYRLRNEGRTLQNIWELYNLYKGVLQTEKIPGDIVELGVYKGGTAKLICEIKGDRRFHLFDTFEGMPEAGEGDIIQEGAFGDITVEDVKKYLRDYKNVFFYKGLFPETAEAINGRRIAFLHLDVDIYTSTRDALHFFYPLMNRGGMIVSHDYNSKSCPGVKKAFDEFFKKKPEPIIELSGVTQCLITKF
jgi:O-methyltransferase